MLKNLAIREAPTRPLVKIAENSPALLLLFGLLLVCGPALAASYVTNAEDRCVDGVVAAFKRLDHHGEPMGFNVDEDIINPSKSCHWQSIARHPHAGNVFYVTKNQNSCVFFSEAGLGIVRLGSDQSNIARRSNLHDPGSDFQNSAPPPDHGIERFRDFRFGYEHLGGMQAAGDLLAIPYERSTTGQAAMAALFDIRWPEFPVALAVENSTGSSRTIGLFVEADSMGAVGVLPDGALPSGAARYVVLALFDENSQLGLWSLFRDPATPGVVSVGGSPITMVYGGPAFQNLQLVKDCGGTLYAIGTRTDDGKDAFAYLYEVDVDRNTETGSIDSFGGINLVTTLHMFCTNAATDGERYCDFRAGAGVYVDPQGTLALYGVEHDNDGHDHSTKVTEFWDRTGNPSQGCDAEGAWVTLYADVDFASQTLTMTHFNESSDDFDDFTSIPWNDAASSLRACLPHGCDVEFCLHSFFDDAEDSCASLTGPATESTTRLRSIANLHASGYGDAISAIRFDGTCGPVGGWATGEPNDQNGEDCVEIRANGLLNDNSCNRERPWACQSLTDPLRWIRSEEVSTWSASLSCAVGYAFTYPQDAVEQQALASQIGETVWVNLTDRAQEGRFVGTSFSQADEDEDGVATVDDNCPDDANSDQEDFDGDGEGDACDLDDDNDGLDDDEEALLGSDPLDADSDGDGLEDGAEVNTYGTDPVDSDSDDDGLSDGDEVNAHGTDPLDGDTDDDGLPDGLEVSLGVTDPLDADSDDDGLLDGQDVEFVSGSIAATSSAAWGPGANGQQVATEAHLRGIERAHAKGHSNARTKLELLRRRFDGCGPGPDADDWVIDCGAQLEIRTVLDLLGSHME